MYIFTATLHISVPFIFKKLPLFTESDFDIHVTVRGKIR
jgi:hypothetical protein